MQQDQVILQFFTPIYTPYPINIRGQLTSQELSQFFSHRLRVSWGHYGKYLTSSIVEVLASENGHQLKNWNPLRKLGS